MNRTRTASLLVLLAASATVGSRAVPQELPKCSNAKVQYRPFDPKYSDRIAVQWTKASQVPSQSGEKQYSPQRTMWQSRVEPDYMKEGPWSSTVYLGSDGSDKVLRLSFLDHASGGVQLQWLNEKLVFGVVWWGRIGSTDFVLDIDKPEFIYRQMAWYGELTQNCRE